MISVLVVDDSAIIRQIFTNELSKCDDIQVIDTASDPYVAREKIVSLNPDVITLDLEMPKMNGLFFLEKLMKHYPVPVVVVSSITPQNAENAVKALELGAVEVISKPTSQGEVPRVIQQLAMAIRSAAKANLDNTSLNPENSFPITKSRLPRHLIGEKILAIGASTGGTQAIEILLRSFPETAPGTLIVQHMPPNFTETFAKRLNKVCKIEVREACDNDKVAQGVALVAPGDKHLLLERNDANYYVRVKDGPPVQFHRPSVDVLFQSVARTAQNNAIGVILTGMGSDGAKGLLTMKENGAETFAQDETSCVVFGMPKAAIKLGAANNVMPLTKLPLAILQVA